MVECIFPQCPKCHEGHLVPFSRGQDIFEFWRCTNCQHTVYKKTGF